MQQVAMTVRADELRDGDEFDMAGETWYVTSTGLSHLSVCVFARSANLSSGDFFNAIQIVFFYKKSVDIVRTLP